MQLKYEKGKDEEREGYRESMSPSNKHREREREEEWVRFEAANLFIRRLVLAGMRNNSNSNHI